MSQQMFLHYDLVAHSSRCPSPLAWQHGLRTTTALSARPTAVRARVNLARKPIHRRVVPHQLRAMRRGSQLTAPKANPSKSEQQSAGPEQGESNTLSSIAGLLLWAGFVGVADYCRFALRMYAHCGTCVTIVCMARHACKA